jgi:hypothetical protein
MKYTIDSEVLKANGITLPELLMLMIMKTGSSPPELVDNMLKKQMIVKDGMFGQYLLTSNWADVMSTVLLDSDESHESQDRVEALAIKLMEIFPKGKKEGTVSTYWRGNKKDIALKLKKFFKLYSKYSDETILEATKSYVDSFNGDYNYMRVLKYFIWKDEVKCIGGVNQVIETSDLATVIENLGQEEEIKQEWTSKLN